MDEQQDLKAWKGLKELPPDTTAFEASGTKYRVARSVSMDRWEAYELLSVEVGLGRSFAQLMQGLREAYDLTNQVASGKPVFADTAVLLRDLLMGAASVNEGHAHPVLKMCCLFINYEGEDVRTINDEIIAKKLDDWRNEGIDMGFFRLCPPFYSGLLGRLQSRHPRYFERAEEGAGDGGRKHFEVRLREINRRNHELIWVLTNGLQSEAAAWRDGGG